MDRVKPLFARVVRDYGVATDALSKEPRFSPNDLWGAIIVAPGETSTSRGELQA